MKNKIISIVSCVFILCFTLQLVVQATENRDVEIVPYYVNTFSASCNISFDEQGGKITARVTGHSGTYIDAYLNLYEVNASTMILIGSWELHSNRNALFSEGFDCESGKTYYAMLEATVTSDSYVEPVTVTDTKICQ